jgi:hypothetical protein
LYHLCWNLSADVTFEHTFFEQNFVAKFWRHLLYAEKCLVSAHSDDAIFLVHFLFCFFQHFSVFNLLLFSFSLYCFITIISWSFCFFSRVFYFLTLFLSQNLLNWIVCTKHERDWL